MKIIAGKYPEIDEWQDWVKFKYPHGSKCSLVFLRRLGAFAKDIGVRMTNVLGYRPIEETQRLYEEDLKANGGKPSGKVAKPGLSWHEFGLAVDLDGTFWRSLLTSTCLDRSRLNQPLLNQYGLILPLNKVDSPSVQEWWHIQPIETAYGIAASERKNFLDKDDVIYGGGRMDLKEFQTAMKHIGYYTGKIDGIVGPLTRAAAEACLPLALEILDLPNPQLLKQGYDSMKTDLLKIKDIAAKYNK